MGAVFAAPPLGTVFAAPPLGTVFAAPPLGTVFAAPPLGTVFAAPPLGAVFATRAAVAVAGAGRDEERGGDAATERADVRGVPPDRNEDGRPLGARRESVFAADVAERSLRAAGVTAVGVIFSSDLQLAGGAQVR